MGKVYVIGRDEVPNRICLSEGESLNMTLVSLPGTSASLSLEVDAEGMTCEIDIAGVYLCDNDDKLNINVIVRHNCPFCFSRQLFKGIVGGSAKASFNGLIYVAKDAQKTKAYQENHTILLTDSARVESMPQLEIYADDVECSHGSSSGYLNMNEKFYLRSRGIPELEAEKLQKVAFLAPVLKRLPDTITKEVYDCLDYRQD